MQIDHNALAKLISMNDAELKKLVSAAAGESGFSLPSISAEDISKLRAALSGMENDPSVLDAIMKSATESKKHN